MTPSDRSNHCQWTLENIESYLDDELDAPSRETFERHVNACPACAAELEFARRVVVELRALPQLRSPDRVVDAAATRVLRGSIIDRLRAWLDSLVQPALRPAMVAMLVVLAAATIFVVSLRDRSEQQMAANGYSKQEIEQARTQALIAFAYVGKYTNRAGRIVTQEVLGERVFGPVREAVDESREEIVDEIFLDPISEAMLLGIFPETKSDDKRSE